MPHRKQNIGCQQALMENSTVFSHQWIILPADQRHALTPEIIVEKYLHHIRRFTLSTVRPFRTPETVEFRLFGLPIPLICFTGPHRTGSPEMQAMELTINGGILVHKEACDRGHLRFSIRTNLDSVRIELRLSDYCPLLLGGENPSPIRKWCYRVTQAYLHKIVTVRFLARLYREVTGHRLPRGVSQTPVPDGENL